MLGLQRSAGSFTPLGLVHPQGGLVPQMVLLVRRKHPNLMWQRTSDGCPVTTSLRAHVAAVEAAQAGQEQVTDAAMPLIHTACSALNTASFSVRENAARVRMQSSVCMYASCKHGHAWPH